MTWPDEQAPYFIAGWLFDDSVQAAHISERAAHIPRDVSRLIRALGPGERDLATSIGVMGVLVAKEAVAKATGLGLGGALSRWPVLDAELAGPYPIVNVATPDQLVVSAQLFAWNEFMVGVALIPPA
jgi:hypothetical protein